MELADIVESLRRHWRVAIAMVVLGVVALGIFLVTRNEVRPPDRFKATVQVLIPARDTDGLRPSGVPPSLLQGQLTMALSNGVRQEALKRSRLEANDVDFEASLNAAQDIVLLSATTGETEQSLRAATQWANSFVDARGAAVARGADSAQRRYRTAIGIYADRIAQIERQLRAAGIPLPATAAGSAADFPPQANEDQVLLLQTRATLISRRIGARNNYASEVAESLTPSAYANIVERQAPRQVTPPLPSPLVPAAIILGAGLLLALAVPAAIDRLDHSVSDGKTAAAMFEAPVLTLIPAMTRREQTTLAPTGSLREAAFRSLAATSVATDRLPTAIMVTSPVGRIQDTVAANFAASLASMGLRVALVATDARQSWFLDGTRTGSADAITLPDLLDRAHRGSLNGEIGHRLAVSELANLVIVPPGPSGGLDLPLDGLPPLLDALSSADIDVTVIAGPPLLEDPNATIFAWATRSVLWAVEAGEVSKAEAQEAASRLVLAGVTPFGVALVSRES